MQPSSVEKTLNWKSKCSLSKINSLATKGLETPQKTTRTTICRKLGEWLAHRDVAMKKRLRCWRSCKWPCIWVEPTTVMTSVRWSWWHLLEGQVPSKPSKRKIDCCSVQLKNPRMMRRTLTIPMSIEWPMSSWWNSEIMLDRSAEDIVRLKSAPCKRMSGTEAEPRSHLASSAWKTSLTASSSKSYHAATNTKLNALMSGWRRRSVARYAASPLCDLCRQRPIPM